MGSPLKSVRAGNLLEREVTTNQSPKGIKQKVVSLFFLGFQMNNFSGPNREEVLQNIEICHQSPGSSLDLADWTSGLSG